MKTNVIDTISGVPILRMVWDESDGGGEVVTFTAGAQVDNDGSGSDPEHDPDHQSDTKLHNNGKPLNAETEQYVVAPPQLIRGTKGILMGSMVHCYNQTTKTHATGVVGDEGPSDKIGEVSVAMARALGVPDSPISGGVDAHVIQYVIDVGTPAPGYSLQLS